MVDVVVNNVMATTTSPDFTGYLMQDPAHYHPYCRVQFGNTTSEQECWLGDERVPLPDVNTRHPEVIQRYGEWIQDMVKTYDIDGLRIDGTYPQAFNPLI